MQMNLESDIGGVQKVREAKMKEQELPQATLVVELDNGEKVEVSSPEVSPDPVLKRLALYRKQSF